LFGLLYPHVTARNNECLMAATSIVCNSQGLFAALRLLLLLPLLFSILATFFRKLPDRRTNPFCTAHLFPVCLHEYAISGLDLFLFRIFSGPPFHLQC